MSSRGNSRYVPHAEWLQEKPLQKLATTSVTKMQNSQTGTALCGRTAQAGHCFHLCFVQLVDAGLCSRASGGQSKRGKHSIQNKEKQEVDEDSQHQDHLNDPIDRSH